MLEHDTPGIGSDSSEVRGLLEVGRIDEAQNIVSGFSYRIASNPLSLNRTAGEPMLAATSGPLAGPSQLDELAANQRPTKINGISIQQQEESKDRIEKARKKLAEAATADDETQATQELKEALGVYLDRDLEERERVLKAVRADLEKMQQRLEKRADSKSTIVELHFKLFLNEANGLAFFSPPTNHSENLLGR